MMSQSMRASRFMLARVVRQQAPISRRTFAVSASSRADLIQDMYLKELRAYKTPQVKASDAEGHVQKFTPPKAPKSPEETDLQGGLKAYEDSVVDIETGSATAEGAEAPSENWFEEEPEAEEAHGH